MGIASALLLVLGNIYPLMMYIEYDINLYKPRVSDYLLDRLNWYKDIKCMVVKM